MLLSAFMIWTRRADGWKFALSMIVIFSAIFFFFWLSTAYPWKKALYFAMRIFIVGEFAAFIEWQMFYYGLTAMGLPLNMGVNVIFLLVIHPIVFGVVYLMERRYRDFNESLIISWSDLMTVFLTGLLIFTLSNMSFAFPDTPFSASKALDTILTAKTLRCQGLGISLTCVADGRELDFIKPTDLSVLFGNALDNAIESVEKIADVEKRLIHVSVVRQKSFLRIRIENCFEGKIRFSGGLPATGKDARYHGCGMKSIQSIVEKYNGSMTIKAENGWFELRILFPVPKAAAS